MVSITDIDKAARCIQNGGLVAFPTETVYGLGANALHAEAVAKIFECKERPSFDPLIVHIADIEAIHELAEVPHDCVYTLAEAFWPGPLTIVLPKKNTVPDIVTAGLPTVGIRIPQTEIARELIKKSNCPIAAPSANKFGQLSPTTAQHVLKQLSNLDYVIDGGKTSHGIESTVVTIQDNTCVILRPGIITKEDISSVLPFMNVEMRMHNTELSAPGLLESHYSPRKPLYIIPKSNSTFDFPEKSGLILHESGTCENVPNTVFYTSKSGNLVEVASTLFEALHFMEDCNEVDTIFVYEVPLSGLGIAIMDRLSKAAHRYK